jgi:hypothetical protein
MVFLSKMAKSDALKRPCPRSAASPLAPCPGRWEMPWCLGSNCGGPMGTHGDHQKLAENGWRTFQFDGFWVLEAHFPHEKVAMTCYDWLWLGVCRVCLFFGHTHLHIFMGWLGEKMRKDNNQQLATELWWWQVELHLWKNLGHWVESPLTCWLAEDGHDSFDLWSSVKNAACHCLEGFRTQFNQRLSLESWQPQHNGLIQRDFIINSTLSCNRLIQNRSFVYATHTPDLMRQTMDPWTRHLGILDQNPWFSSGNHQQLPRCRKVGGDDHTGRSTLDILWLKKVPLAPSWLLQIQTKNSEWKCWRTFWWSGDMGMDQYL